MLWATSHTYYLVKIFLGKSLSAKIILSKLVTGHADQPKISMQGSLHFCKQHMLASCRCPQPPFRILHTTEVFAFKISSKSEVGAIPSCSVWDNPDGGEYSFTYSGLSSGIPKQHKRMCLGCWHQTLMHWPWTFQAPSLSCHIEPDFTKQPKTKNSC